MSAALLALAQRAAAEMARGALKQLLIEGEDGIVLLIYVDADTILALSAKPNKNIGRIFIEAKKTALKILEVQQRYQDLHSDNDVQ